ncbi:hypothetical protein Tco_1091780 [Tanacetum coccineum]|uniref:Uncharacterized protein n=1 Tax=Tanacetum coccineum TaxID=301880 RepID=A0ABQ5IAC5_9ASTR
MEGTNGYLGKKRNPSQTVVVWVLPCNSHCISFGYTVTISLILVLPLGAVLLEVAWSPTLKANDGIGICLGSRVVVVCWPAPTVTWPSISPACVLPFVLLLVLVISGSVFQLLLFFAVLVACVIPPIINSVAIQSLLHGFQLRCTTLELNQVGHPLTYISNFVSLFRNILSTTAMLVRKRWLYAYRHQFTFTLGSTIAALILLDFILGQFLVVLLLLQVSPRHCISNLISHVLTCEVPPMLEPFP